MKTKRLLIIGFLLVSLIPILMWLCGWRMEYVREMILLHSKPPKLSTEETTELHTWLKKNAIHLDSVEAGSGYMGDYLRRTYGDDMVVIGLLSNRKFSESPENSDETPLTRDGTLQATLAQAGLDIAVVDFRSLPKGVVSKYFNSPIRAGGVETIYPLSYDAILFIESTTNARQWRSRLPVDLHQRARVARHIPPGNNYFG